MSKTLKTLLAVITVLAAAVLPALLPAAAESEPAVKHPSIVVTVSNDKPSVGEEIEITVSIVGLDDPAVKDIRGMQVNIAYDSTRLEWVEQDAEDMLLAHTSYDSDFMDVGHNSL